jgi:glycosyltransferase involved in cell wall biosynthesis
MKNSPPLVSIMIPNRNHAVFLGQCIESALAQTYNEIEVVVLDNCSDDNSVEVASRYVKAGVRVCRNPHNIINSSYKVLTELTGGKYMVLLCADDLIKPAFVETCVKILENHPNVGYVHCERDYVDVRGRVTELDPFYNCSFIAPGEAALPIYMLTDVAQPAQCLMRRATFERVQGYDTEFDHTNADKGLWFRLSMISDYAYVREKLALIRIHEARESTVGFRNFFHPLAIYLTLDYQATCARQAGFDNAVQRLPAAMRKLATESLQIAFSCLREGSREVARQYLLFARMICDDIINDEKYEKIRVLYERNELAADNAALQTTEHDVFIHRTRNYPPPEGFQTIEVHGP